MPLVSNSRAEARQIIVQCVIRTSVLSVVLRNPIYSGMRRNATTVACVGCVVLVSG